MDRYRTKAFDVERESPRDIESWLNEQAEAGYELRQSTAVPGKATGFCLLIVERPNAELVSA